VVEPAEDGGAAVRLRLEVAYDGGEYAGWARQPGQRTVQGEIEAALARVLRTEVALTVAGRTDAGVHATGQVAHVDVPADTWAELAPTLVRRVNGVLPADVRLRGAAAAPAGFDARFSALLRRYTYRVGVAPRGVDPLRRHDTLPWPRPLDLAALNEAGALLLGEHDFAAYCRRREGATTIRRLIRLDWRAEADDVLVATVEADAFCHSMVRSLVGALLAVGEGRRPVGWPAELLRLAARADDVVVAPARGLTLVHVAYPPDAELAARAAATRRLRTVPAWPPAQG
jgi:tRNA pseudouridine38-40 synthase